MTTSKKATSVKRICPCLTSINNEVLNDFADSYFDHTKEKFSIAKAFKDFIIHDCATFVITKNNSAIAFKKYNQILSNTTNNFSSHIKNNPQYKTDDATKIIHSLRQSRVDISKYLFSLKTFSAGPSSNAKCLTEAVPFLEGAKSKKLNLTYSEKDFALIKSRFKSLKRENKNLTYDALFYQFMSELKIYELAFETSFFADHFNELSAFENVAKQSYDRFPSMTVEDFNRYFLETFPVLHGRILASVSGLSKMISIEV